MKKFITFIAALCIALPAMAAPPKKDDKKKEMPPMMYTVVVAGASGDEGVAQVKAFLSAMKGVEVKDCALNGTNVEATISTKEKVQRSDVSKALKDKKELSVKEFKVKHPDKPGDKKPDAKKEEPKKEEPKKTEEPKKPEDPKKPADPK